MERFPDGARVRLRSRDYGGYLRADEDGTGVSLSLGLDSLDMAWRVDRVLHDGSTSIGYCGRYLAASSEPAPPGHRVVLGYCDDSIHCKAVEEGNSSYILLRHVSGRLLRAIDGRGNGVCVSIDAADGESTLVHWKVETIPTSPTARLPAPAAEAIEQFPYGALVRLQSRVHGGYLHADEDGTAVSMRRHLESTNTAWKASRILLLHDGSISVRLQSAANGRFLAASSDPARPGHLGRRVVQDDCDLNLDGVLWEAIGSGDVGGYILLCHVSNRLLRANNGRYGGVSLSIDLAGNRQNTMMHWKVESIPRPVRPPPSEALMKLSPDGAYVRLRSRVNRRSLRGDEDGVRVFFRPDRGSLNAAWRVYRVLHGGTSRVLLQNAAYGRYLGYNRDHPNLMLLQSAYCNDIQQQNLHWEGRSHPAGGGIILVNAERQRPLVNPEDETSTALVVEFIPSRGGPAPILVNSCP